MMRVGQGVDVHAFDDSRPLILGGIRISETGGLAGHSDADAVLHAITDALLGAAGAGDIGQYFPSDDARWKRVAQETHFTLRRCAAEVGTEDAGQRARQRTIGHGPGHRSRPAARACHKTPGTTQNRGGRGNDERYGTR